MIKTVVASISILSAVALSIFGAKGINDYQENALYDSSVFLINQNIEGLCSGTLIDDPYPEDGIQDTILTAKHCVLDMESPVSRNPIGDTIEVHYVNNPPYLIENYTVKWISTKSDLAILQINGKNHKTLGISDAVLDFGDPVSYIGYPLGIGKLKFEGFAGYLTTVEGFGKATETSEFLMASIWANGGSSGSSLVIKTLTGYEIVGVLTGMASPVQGAGGEITFWTPLSEIHAFIQSIKDFD